MDTADAPSTQRVTRRPGEELNPDCIVPTYRSGRKTLIVSGSIAHGRKGPLVWVKPAPLDPESKGKRWGGGMTGEDYVDQVLLGPPVQFYRSAVKERELEMLLVEDGSGPHRRKSTEEALKALGIRSLAHPPNLPDLNPIEPVWRTVKERIHRIPWSRNSEERLWEATQRVWKALTVKDITKHTSKMDARVQAVRDNKGGTTRF
ncbi:Transposable element Tc1 transposase [Ceratobasidium sp. AG-Ba]|nr:Transposable element Tc1 transposase [Ceratobasidium sp. AG-Ba]